MHFLNEVVLVSSNKEGGCSTPRFVRVLSLIIGTVGIINPGHDYNCFDSPSLQKLLVSCHHEGTEKESPHNR